MLTDCLPSDTVAEEEDWERDDGTMRGVFLVVLSVSEGFREVGGIESRDNDLGGEV